jgi:hypothetical protein
MSSFDHDEKYKVFIFGGGGQRPPLIILFGPLFPMILFTLLAGMTGIPCNGLSGGFLKENIICFI